MTKLFYMGGDQSFKNIGYLNNCYEFFEFVMYSHNNDYYNSIYTKRTNRKYIFKLDLARSAIKYKL